MANDEAKVLRPFLECPQTGALNHVTSKNPFILHLQNIIVTNWCAKSSRNTYILTRSTQLYGPL